MTWQSWFWSFIVLLASGCSPVSVERLDVIKGKDGAEMVLVPAGEFLMGSTQAELNEAIRACGESGGSEQTCRLLLGAELPQHRVILNAFYIDKYKITKALFDRFVRAMDHQTVAERQGSGTRYQQKDGRSEWVPVAGANWRQPDGPGSADAADHPGVQVAWHDAEAYCRWARKRLLTEAEWEKAAGGTDGREYPWGNQWNSAMANGDMTLKTTSPVGAYRAGASPYGAFDMAGNVSEWVADWWEPRYYGNSPVENPRGPEHGVVKALRGGAWLHRPYHFRVRFRSFFYAPDYHNNTIGFRCAQDARP